MDRIVVIVGPTASGKTRLAVEMAKHLNGEVISADSMQIYRGMDIGTAKAGPQEMGGIRHHMLDVTAPEEPFSAAKYVQMAEPILLDLLRQGKTAVIAGGSGLYVDALIRGRTFAPQSTGDVRMQLEQDADRLGMDAMLGRLRIVDPDSAARLHRSDRKRILRALEVYCETGQTITQHNLESQKIPDKYHPVWIGLNFLNRADLYRRIDRRVDTMLEDGLLEEVQSLLESGIPRTCTAMQAIGYKELIPVLTDGAELQDAVETIKRESRHYAKRQLTWFRRIPDIHWILQQEPPDFSKVLCKALAAVSFWDL